MSVSYVAEMPIDLGEAIHIRSIVKPKCEQDLPFSIKEASWELYLYEYLEASGECVINGHEIDAFVSPKQEGTYRLRYIYKVADETWVDNVKLKVG